MKDRLARRKRREEQSKISEETAQTNAIWATMSDEQKMECEEAHRITMEALNEFTRLTDTPQLRYRSHLLLAILMCNATHDDGSRIECSEEFEALRDPLQAIIRAESKYRIAFEYITTTE